MPQLREFQIIAKNLTHVQLTMCLNDRVVLHYLIGLNNKPLYYFNRDAFPQLLSFGQDVPPGFELITSIRDFPSSDEDIYYLNEIL